MDTIKFVIEDYIDVEFGFQFPTVNIYINQKNLIHLVEEIEHAYRAPVQPGKPLPQSYVGHSPEHTHRFREEFLGSTGRPISVLLTCTCREELCNSIVARIMVDSTTVTWSEIRNPFLGGDAEQWIKMEGADQADGYPIDYSGLGPFVFDRKQYIDALNALETGR